MRILIACEASARVRDAMRARGHNAWSCDLLACEGDPRWHIQGDAVQALYDGGPWDMLIGHPECTYLANSGNKHLYRRMKKECGINPERWQSMLAATAFFLALWEAPVKRIALENPIMGRHAKAMIGVQQSQVIQPWMFGHPETKATCLWLKGLPLLTPTHDVRAQMAALLNRERHRVHYMAPGPDRRRDRSRTLPGIAAAMAEQWG